jgi:TM2 domain-containing membrane protein YozV
VISWKQSIVQIVVLKFASKAQYCENCGVRQVSASSTGYQQQQYQQRARYQEKNPGLAAILSFFIVGLGQMYNGQIGKGLLLLVAAIISGILWTIFIGIIFSIVIWIYAIYDAYTTAQRINAGEIIT